MKNIIAVYTTDAWHKEKGELIGFATNLTKATKITKDWLKEYGLKNIGKPLRLTSDDVNMLQQYQQTQRLMQHNNYPDESKVKFSEIIWDIGQLNQIHK